MPKHFFTNHGPQTLLAKFEGVFSSNKDMVAFDALVGYLRSSGWFAIRPSLENVPQVRILVGINVDSLIADYQKKGLLFHGTEGQTLEKLNGDLLEDIQTADYRSEIERGILQFIDDVVSKKIEVRAHPTKTLHAKIYIFRPEGFNEHKPGAVITGSSNLTEAGLGVGGLDSNYEFNVLLHDYDDVKFATDEFDALWREGVEVLPKNLRDITARTYLGTEVTPRQLYFKLLAEYFGNAIDYDPNAAEDLPKGFRRLSYQVDAVAEGLRHLQKHNGFFLADVVGLGKTIVATLIARKFYFHNGFPEHRSHTLIVVPPALEDIWHNAVDTFHLDNVKIITNGSLHKVRTPERYDLIIVDEAHRFRNDTADAFNRLQKICKTPSRRRGVDEQLLPKKVILISATPLNNRPADLRNLIALFQDLKDSTLAVHNLQRFFAAAEKAFARAKLAPDVETARRDVMVIAELIRVRVMSQIIVRRTRRDLDENEEYRSDLESQGIAFPTIDPPRRILYPLQPEIEALYDETILRLRTDGDDGFTYNRYRAISFLKRPKKDKYANADLISKQLATIMRMLLVKRLDSSFHAFRQSLRRFRDSTGVMVEMFKKGAIYIAPNLGVADFLLEGREDELLEAIAERESTDPTISVCEPDDFEDGFRRGLEADYVVLQELFARWDAVQDDPKLETFLLHLPRLFDRADNREGKLVIFSESKETTGWLLQSLKAATKYRILAVDSTTWKELMPVVRANFDANLPEKQQAHDYDIVISTEVLAEGVNLHRANVIVNYDTPWNSTRLMQRIGRVNRIGSLAARVIVWNFYPTSKVDNDIELRKKAVIKLQAFHTALGEDSQIYSQEEEVGTFGLFDKTPEEGEPDERLRLLMELRKFREDNADEFRRIRKLPLRARVGRADASRDGSSVVFIRDQKRDGFFRTRPDEVAIEEISIVEAAREFRTPDPAELAVALPPHHHEDVRRSLLRFEEKAVEAAVAERAVDATAGPNEKKALEFLEAISRLDVVSDTERDLIRLAKTALRKVKFQNLQRDINKLQKSVKTMRVTNAVLADKLMVIIRSYPIDQEEGNAQVKPGASVIPASTTPRIILSESFTS